MKPDLSKIGIGIFVAGVIHGFLLRGVRFESLIFMILGIGVVSFHYANAWVLYRSKRLQKHQWIYRLIVIKIGFLLTIVGVLITLQVMIMTTAMTTHDEDVDYGIVLGAGIVRKEPSFTLARRLDLAVEYLNSHPKGKVVVAGGHSEGQLASEAQVMKWYLESQGIDSKRIMMEDQSTNTFENIKKSIEIIQFQEGIEADKIVIITSDYHLFRAQLIGRRVGVDPYGMKATSPSNLYWYYAARETVALFKSMVTDW